MSRELKFRVWSEEDKEYRTDCRLTELFNSITGSPATVYSEEGDRFDIEQYTGLKDKNGKEIYEGDLVRNCDKCHVDSGEVDAVKVTDDAYLLPFRSSFGSWSPELCEVIGNIHEEVKNE